MANISGEQKIGNFVNVLENAGIKLDVERPVPLAELNDEVKFLYMKVFISLLKIQEDNTPDIARLNQLMTRIKCPLDTRRKVRELLDKNVYVDVAATLNLLSSALDPVDRKGIKYPLVKDMIDFYSINLLDLSPEEQMRKVKSLPALSHVIQVLEMNNEQLEVVIASLHFDQNLLSGKISDSSLEKLAKDLAAKASGVGVPLGILYISGTMGLSAAGITSALAWLGFGGILGLSSMVTGIGVLIVVGTVVYQTVKYVCGSDERDKISRRGLMLRYILVNQQETIANLAEDVFDITQTLKELLINAAQNRKMIDKIISRLSVLQGAANYIKQKEKEAQEEIVKEEEARK